MMKMIARPAAVGLLFGAIGILLTVVGMLRSVTPFQPVNLAVAVLLGGGVWFLVAWAVATAARDVESDIAAQHEPPAGIASADIASADIASADIASADIDSADIDSADIASARK